MEVECTKCLNKWDYQGKSAFWATCPKCKRKNSVFVKENLKYAEIINCGFCGRKFYKKRRSSAYCSPLCQARAIAPVGGKACHEKHDFRGKNNPHWKGGISKNHYHYKKLQVDRYPERIKCREIFFNARERGKIKVPSKCEICNNKTKLHGHHEDYSKPLEVRWVCRPCHRKIHRGTH